MGQENTEEKKSKKLLDEYRTRKLRSKENFNLEHPQKVISDAIARDYPRMAENTRNQVARMMVLQPSDRKIKIGNEEMDINSLDVRIAESIEAINCGTSSKEEYHDWINTGQAVVSDMNTNGVTEEELSTRNDFIADLNQREVELMACLGLYQKAMNNNPQVRARYDELYAKLQKLREIRSAVRNATKDTADKIEEQKKNNQPINIFPSQEDKNLMIATVGALSIYDKMTTEDKKSMDMYHGNDFNNTNFYAHLSNYFMYNGDVRSGNKEIEEVAKTYETSPLEAKNAAKRTDQKSVANYLLELTGRKQSFASAPSKPETKYENLSFDKEAYNKIAQLRARMGR